jgi:hypothetical protein
VLVGEPREILRGIRPAPAALTFQTRGLGHPRDVSLIPYYRIAHERYNLYWKVVRSNGAKATAPQAHGR